jgi:hypothetical protein
MMMRTTFLDHLAGELRRGKSPACRRAIGRCLSAMQERFERGEFESPSRAEAEFRKLVDAESACREDQTNPVGAR